MVAWVRRPCIAGAVAAINDGVKMAVWYGPPLTDQRTTMSERPPTPTEDRKPAWRRACLAYSEMRQAGASDQQAHEAAVEAVQTVLPLAWKEASAEAVNKGACALSPNVSGGGAQRISDPRRAAHQTRIRPSR